MTPKIKVGTHSVPIDTLFVDEYSHEFRDGHGRVSVVQLDGTLIRQLAEVVSGYFTNAELGVLEPKNN